MIAYCRVLLMVTVCSLFMSYAYAKPSSHMNDQQKARLNHAQKSCINWLEKRFQGATQKEVQKQLEPMFYQCLQRYGFAPSAGNK